MIKRILKTLTAAALALLPGVMATSCLSNDDPEKTDKITVVFNHRFPEADITGDQVTECLLTLKELNTGRVTTADLLAFNSVEIPMGVYNIEGAAKVSRMTLNNEWQEKTMRVSLGEISVTAPMIVGLEWFFSNIGGSLVFSEIYAAGSPNAAGTGGLRDSYFRIYNNSDEVVYADGLAICESAFVNARNNTFEILTPANNRDENFTAGTIWVIPGSGKEHPIAPGESIKIVDQAIDWSAQVPGALNHSDADFEWYDDHAQDTDVPTVPNLDKWFCYSNTIWILANQCNRSYALVKFPEYMTAEAYLAKYHGAYEYVHTTGTHMTNDKAYLIDNEWILDGVNLGNDATYVIGALSKSVDFTYASISPVDKDPNRFGKVFARKTATMIGNRVHLLDTNDSANDFELKSAR